jgi:hypothetical protein
MRRTLGRIDRHVSRLLHHFVTFVANAFSPFNLLRFLESL